MARESVSTADRISGGVVAMPPSGQPRFSRQAAPSTRAAALGFGAAPVRRAVGGKFCRGQIAKTDAVALRGVTGNRAACSEFDVVRMRTEDERDLIDDIRASY